MLALWKPFGGLFNLSDDVDDLCFVGNSNGNQVGFTPAVDIEENETSFIIRADLPGISEKDIEVKVDDGVLLLSGKRERVKEEKTKGSYYSERSYGSFCRQFTLDSKVEASKIEATYKNGVLSVMLPKAEVNKPRQIPIINN